MADTREIWVDIKNYEGKYRISNLGRVKRGVKTNIYKDKDGDPEKNPLGNEKNLFINEGNITINGGIGVDLYACLLYTSRCV